ncbi:hypothetical protein FGO68_gene5198 [Halteria grandinella]|uniref:Uncharacterized protein n=1 Tax=Halteria grandinella TaxID=5974 RepID=A0A8J8NKT4_HALGN|nr:hypothetical protein FGO68_gene5198 [Halteria grandinella]
MKDGVREGFGRVYRTNGTLSYVGNFSNSMRDGYSAYMKSSGAQFEGEFQGAKFNSTLTGRQISTVEEITLCRWL